jgi:hypothetical protein
MIGQYLPNNNEKRYSAILPKISNLNRPYVYTLYTWVPDCLVLVAGEAVEASARNAIELW